MLLPVQLRKRKPDTHKGDYGYVLVIGGSSGLTGAVCLASQACLRMGAGLVKAGVPRSLHDIFEIKLTEVMTLPLEDTAAKSLSFGALKKITEAAEKADAVALGCGAGLHRLTQALMRKLIIEIDKPLVVDADAINALAHDVDILKKRKSRNLVITPHLREFSRLTKLTDGAIKKERKELVKEFAIRYNLVLVLKGFQTLVSNGEKVFENHTGNPGMATAGSGDVLTGIIAGLIAQGLDCFEAAITGVHLHGLAGDYAVKEKTESCLIASDIIECLPEAIKSCLRRCAS